MQIKGLDPNTISDKIFPLEHATVVRVPTEGKTANLKMPFVDFARKQATSKKCACRKENSCPRSKHSQQ